MPDVNVTTQQAATDGDSRLREPITELSHLERMFAVCDLFVQGKTVSEILKEMEARYGKAGKMKRETPYKLVREAGKRGFIHFTPPPDHAFERRISDHFFWLNRVNVVRTVVPLDTARETANVLLRLVQDCHRKNPERDEVHIGFAAGLSMRAVAQFFAHKLTYPQPDMPDTIVFHAMLSGHDKGDPTTDPNSYFSYYVHPPTLQTNVRFVGFRAPAIVRTSSIADFMEIPELTEAYDEAGELDIIATSGADWEDEHSSLLNCMKRSESTLQTLRDAGTVGDMLWRPLGETAPVTIATEIRALTLVELGQLPEFIERGKHVLLMLGPCSVCNRHKGEILKTILSQDMHLVSHVVADSRTAGYLVKLIDRGLV
jgi:DNA-binding transcriptional regulator LsrR (DeoR family)